MRLVYLVDGQLAAGLLALVSSFRRSDSENRRIKTLPHLEVWTGHSALGGPFEVPISGWCIGDMFPID